MRCAPRHMVESTAHKVEHVFSAGPVLQWEVVFWKRLRHYLYLGAGCLNRFAGIALSEVERATAEASTSNAAAPSARLFLHGFGAPPIGHSGIELGSSGSRWQCGCRCCWRRCAWGGASQPSARWHGRRGRALLSPEKLVAGRRSRRRIEERPSDLQPLLALENFIATPLIGATTLADAPCSKDGSAASDSDSTR